MVLKQTTGFIVVIDLYISSTESSQAEGSAKNNWDYKSFTSNLMVEHEPLNQATDK